MYHKVFAFESPATLKAQRDRVELENSGVFVQSLKDNPQYIQSGGFRRDATVLHEPCSHPVGRSHGLFMEKIRDDMPKRKLGAIQNYLFKVYGNLFRLWSMHPLEEDLSPRESRDNRELRDSLREPGLLGE
jgi:hypothetical protein